MPTFTAPMRTDESLDRPCRKASSKDAPACRALVLLEMLIVLIILALMTALATLAFSTGLTRTKFEREAHAFISVLKMAQNAAAESNMRYAVALDFDEQSYALRPFTASTLDFEQIIDEEPLIASGYFSEQCYLDYILFDDFEDTRDVGEDIFRAWFVAGHSGWQYGGKIVFLDADGNPYSVVINRLSRVIMLKPGDVEILVPQYKEDVPF